MLNRSLRVCFVAVCAIIFALPARADEGMWLPFLINKNFDQMRKLGIKLSPEDIYNANQSSLKDAIVNFGNFCTGEMISAEGLLLTNHHCGFDAIQSHSSVEHDYLTDGFWAKSRSEELSNPGLTVTFLVKMEDVTGRLKNKTEAEKEAEIETIIKEYSEGTHYSVEVENFFEGNQQIVFVYEIFKDVRLVGAPPSAVGKFGGDTDNWMWPRHTGDFSMFRVYMGKDGKPADYSKDNIPYAPKKHLTISLAGIKKGDYAMIMGYPGSTERYMTSYGVAMAYEQSNPAVVKIRDTRLKIMKEHMDADAKVKIQYASKYATVSNYWKYFIGQNQGLRRLDVINDKRKEEEAFTKWVQQDTARVSEYGEVLPKLDKAYNDYRKVNLTYVYLREAIFGSEALLLAYRMNTLYTLIKNDASKDDINAALTKFKSVAEEFYKDYDKATDEEVTAALLKMYYNDIPKSMHSSVFQTIEKKYKLDFNKYVKIIFAKSILTNEASMKAFLANPDAKLLDKDAVFQAMYKILMEFRANQGPAIGNANMRLEKLNGIYLKGILEQRNKEVLYPDANFTMRLTYGTVQDYFPRDAVYYNYYTTIDGIIEKEDSTNEEFIVPTKLKELYQTKDYGQYVNEEGKVPICFLTTNDITGGNSGSPVMNAQGHLIGCAFDGNWEAMSGDIIYEPELQRTISVDIRYILFMVDKYAGAGYLLKEMTIVR
ncbi:MAG: S46 family peptidase [Cytophagaceae bacterium]